MLTRVMDTYKRTMVKMPKSLHDSMRRMCILTNKNMTEFIRMSVQNQINELKKTIQK